MTAECSFPWNCWELGIIVMQICLSDRKSNWPLVSVSVTWNPLYSQWANTSTLVLSSVTECVRFNWRMPFPGDVRHITFLTGDPGLKIQHCSYHNFLRSLLESKNSFSIQILLLPSVLHRCQTCIVIWQLSWPSLALSNSLLANKSFACLISSWCLLLGELN